MPTRLGLGLVLLDTGTSPQVWLSVTTASEEYGLHMGSLGPVLHARSFVLHVQHAAKACQIRSPLCV